MGRSSSLLSVSDASFMLACDHPVRWPPVAIVTFARHLRSQSQIVAQNESFRLHTCFFPPLFSSASLPLPLSLSFSLSLSLSLFLFLNGKTQLSQLKSSKCLISVPIISSPHTWRGLRPCVSTSTGASAAKLGTTEIDGRHTSSIHYHSFFGSGNNNENNIDSGFKHATLAPIHIRCP